MTPPTVAFIHSTGLGPFMWTPYLQCAGNAPTRAPFNRGYAPDDVLAPPAVCGLADDAAHLAARLADAGPVHLVAHSWGATVALEIARAQMLDVRSLWLYEPVLFGALAADPATLDAATAADLLAVVRSFRHTSLDEAGTEAWLRDFVAYWNGPGAWDGMSQRAWQAMRRVGWKMYQEVRSTFEDTSSFEAFRLDLPVTLVLGGKSPRPARAMTRRLAQVMPRAQVRELTALGHMSVLTHPADIAPLLRAHLQVRREDRPNPITPASRAEDARGL